MESHIKYVQFLNSEIEIIYIDNSRKRFCFQKLGAKEDLDFANQISSQIDKVLEVNENPCEQEGIYGVMYEELHIFSSKINKNKINVDKYKEEWNKDEFEEWNEDENKEWNMDEDNYEEEDDDYEYEGGNEYQDNNSNKKQRTGKSFNNILNNCLFNYFYLNIYFYFIDLSTTTSRESQSKKLEPQEIHSNIISSCLLLSVISCGSNLDKIEIYPEKCKAILKNQLKTTSIEPVNVNYVKKLIKTIKFPKFEPVDLEEAINGPVSSLSFLIDYKISENNILKGNKMRVAKLYSDFRLLENGLPVVAPFFDPNSGVCKSEYYIELIKHLQTIIKQNSTTIPTEFCYSLIKGALDLDSYLESYFEQINTEQPVSVQEQIILLRKAPSIFSEQSLNNNTKIIGEQSLNNNTKLIEERLDTFSNLMSKCYNSINNLDIVAYSSEVSRRISLRKLYEFQQSYLYLKEWVRKLADRKKGTKAASQVRALLLGRITIYQLLNIDQIKSNHFKI
jgi:hypothetical protein